MPNAQICPPTSSLIPVWVLEDLELLRASCHPWPNSEVHGRALAGHCQGYALTLGAGSTNNACGGLWKGQVVGYSEFEESNVRQTSKPAIPSLQTFTFSIWPRYMLCPLKPDSLTARDSVHIWL